MLDRLRTRVDKRKEQLRKKIGNGRALGECYRTSDMRELTDSADITAASITRS